MAQGVLQCVESHRLDLRDRQLHLPRPRKLSSSHAGQLDQERADGLLVELAESLHSLRIFTQRRYYWNMLV